MAALTLSIPNSKPFLQISRNPSQSRLNFLKFKPHCSLESPERKTGVVVIGAGLAGLAAATRLTAAKIPFLLLEASDAVGGRVRTDSVDGFILDRGFQIFITAYPEAQKLLDYEALNLKKFYSGARVFHDGRFYTVADPLRHFWDALGTLTNPIGSVVDKLLIGLTRIRVLTRSDSDILSANEVPTIDMLRKIGFSDSIIGGFFRPFFGGVFFDKELETTSRLFDFVFKCLALGENALPSNGISAIPEQLAAKLPSNSLLLNSKVASVKWDDSISTSPTVTLQNGDVIRSELGVLVAVEELALDKLLPENKPAAKIKKPPRSTVCVYFSAEKNEVPVPDPVLFLNGSGKGIVNNMFFATNVAPSYAPPGKALVSVSLIGLYEDLSDDDLTVKIIRELSEWFGDTMVKSWKHLRTYRIKYAQPDQCPPTNLMKNPRFGPGVYLCGDHQTSATFDGALVSGRKAAEALLKEASLVSI